MEHTKEPWSLYWDDAKYCILAGDRLIAEMGMCEPTVKTAPQDKANAARIVACINACAGIPTEELRQRIK